MLKAIGRAGPFDLSHSGSFAGLVGQRQALRNDAVGSPVGYLEPAAGDVDLTGYR